ncbi:MAG TPA: isoprenylcysteine carboxylmethyltransferase family protein [Gemmatimonadaceae bacterium]
MTPDSNQALRSDAISAAERSPSARFGAVLFRNRGWLPVPFILVPLLVPGHESTVQWIVGAIVLTIGEAIRMAGVAAAGTVTRRRSRDVQRLVTYGIFRWARNPLYIGNLLVWIGFVVISGVFWFVPVAVVLFAVEYALIVRYEEGVLESIFGAEYLAYKRATPRWIPRPPAVPESGPHDWGEAWKSEISTFVQYAVLAALFVAKQKYF